MALRIQQYVERLIRSRTEIFDEAHRKRGPPELVDGNGNDSSKRQKIGAAVAAPITNLVIPPFTPGPHSIAELFTITQDKGLIFDVSQIPEDLVASIGVALMSQLDEGLLRQAIKVSLRSPYRDWPVTNYDCRVSAIALNPSVLKLRSHS